MRERPILFSAPMVRAILADTKTQTRRVVKPRKDPDYGCYLAPGEVAGDENQARLCPYGQPGDRLWVRESHSIGPGPGVPLQPGESAGTLRWPHVTYLADGAIERRDTRWKGAFGVTRPSIHMPRWASRITLRITDVRVERLQDISDADAIAEGGTEAEPGWWTHEGLQLNSPGSNRFGGTPIDSYRALWEQINGPGSWDANPWVWVLSFEREEPTR
jgi:hypothetical protein